MPFGVIMLTTSMQYDTLVEILLLPTQGKQTIYESMGKRQEVEYFASS